MKINNHLLAGVALLSPLALSSCFDSDYDLSDIDTTVRLQTTDLVVPLNIDVLTLDQVMDIDDDSEIVKDTVNGIVMYSIKKEGTFDSDPINVNSFIADKTTINSTSSTLPLSKSDLPFGVTGSYLIENVSPASFDAEAENVDESIHEIEYLGVNTTFRTILRFENLSKDVLDNMKFQDVILKFPVGLVGSYKDISIDPESGILDLSKETFSPNDKGEVEIDVNVLAIDAKGGDISFDYENHKLAFAGEIAIVKGIVYVNDVPANTLPEIVQFDLQPEMNDVVVNTFTGKLEYKVNDFEIDPVDLSSLPDFLNQTGTKIMLENPQIYLSVTNPMDSYGVYFQTGFELTAMRDGKSETYSIDDGVFHTPKNTDPKHQFVLSPKEPSYYYKGYENPNFVPFSSLKNVLADVDGMPTSISVNAIDPKMPSQPVTDFRLGEELSPVVGSYAFYAPLQLSKDSRIVYTDTINGWNDEDVDALTFSKIMVNFDATTDLPYELELSIVPITFDGKDMKNVKSSKVLLEANAKNYPVELRIEGSIEHLDGIKIKANVVSKGDDAMRPDMNLYVKNCKITFTGYYEKEL